MTLVLLRDIHIETVQATRIAAEHPFERVRSCAASWWMNRRAVGGKLENSPGIVLYWLDNWPDRPPNTYDVAAWRQTDLYRQHRTPAELAAGDDGGEQERVAMYLPAEFRAIAIGLDGRTED